MSNRYGTKKPHEVRAAAKGPRKIGERGTRDRRVLNGVHVTKGRAEWKSRDIANTAAGELYISFIQ
jgi:hypothetical protein